MEETYTFIARSAKDPLKVATFTLHNSSVSVGIGVPAEQIRTTVEARSAEDENGDAPKMWMKPVALSVIGRASEPFRLYDVTAKLERGSLHVTAWMRAAGLRLAPINLTWEQVDNPEAAEGFVQEIQRRKTEVRPAGRMPGPLDYWWTWITGAISILGLGTAWIVRRLRRDRSALEHTE
jgi:hypothetical protein